jgi:large subunit ribosomal protein L30
MAEKRLRITQTRSVIGRTQDQRATVRSLGLKRIRHTVEQPDRPEIRGMLRKVPHLVEWVEVEDAPQGNSRAADGEGGEQEGGQS